MRQLFPTIGVVKELQNALVTGMQLRRFTQPMHTRDQVCAARLQIIITLEEIPHSALPWFGGW